MLGEGGCTVDGCKVGSWSYAQVTGGEGRIRRDRKRPGLVRIFSFLKNNSVSSEFIYEELHGYDISYMKYI